MPRSTSSIESSPIQNPSSPSGAPPTAAAPPPDPTPSVPVPPGVGMAPATTLPPIPDGYVAPDLRAYLGWRPTKGQLAAIPGALTDLASFVDYTSALGAAAPPIPTVVGLARVGQSWRSLRNEAQAWLAFVNAQDAIAWKAALSSFDEVKPLFLIAVAKNPALAGMYPGLTQLFEAGKVTARLSAATRRKAAQAQATAAKKAADDEAEADKAAAARAAATAAKTVTVTA